MKTDLQPIIELYRLWSPVYPYLARHFVEMYGRQDGNILEMGPFCGVIFELHKIGVGSSFSIAAFPPGIGDFFRGETRRLRLEGRIEVRETDSSLTGVLDNGVDLVLFRGAFFFPDLFKIDFSSIYRILSANGIAFIGGGFGKLTPDSVIKEIGKRSRDLNRQLGKIEMGEERLKKDIESSRLQGSFQVISEGGLWVIMRKEPLPVG